MAHEVTLIPGDGTGPELIDATRRVLEDGARYFGLLQVVNGSHPEDFGLVVGLRNSHDKSFPAGLVVGASVFVCDNLSFSGEVTFERKHTANMLRDLSWMISETVSSVSDRLSPRSTPLTNPAAFPGPHRLASSTVSLMAACGGTWLR